MTIYPCEDQPPAEEIYERMAQGGDCTPQLCRAMLNFLRLLRRESVEQVVFSSTSHRMLRLFSGQDNSLSSTELVRIEPVNPLQVGFQLDFPQRAMSEYVSTPEEAVQRVIAFLQVK